MSDDLISRQDAIDAVRRMLRRKFGIGGDLAEITLAGLLSAQPEKRTEERTETHACDCISRKAAIDALRAMQTYKMCAGDDLLLVDQAGAMTELMMLPSAQPETDGFCDGCKEYDQERHFCPRFDRVIKQAVEDLQIVKCKDCKYWNTVDGKFGICEAVHYDDEVGTYKIRVECSMEDYCSWAERREE